MKGPAISAEPSIFSRTMGLKNSHPFAFRRLLQSLQNCGHF